MPSILIDTSYFVALADRKDESHHRALQFKIPKRSTLLVPIVAMTEICHLVQVRVNYTAMLAMFHHLQSGRYELVAPTNETFSMAHVIGAKYAESEFDFTDCCIMALAEEEQISQICTFDRRDFSIYRPAHVEAFTLLP